MNFSVRLIATYCVVCMLASECRAAAQQPDVLYLNRCAANCTVQFGSDNAVLGQSTLVTGTRTALPFPGSDAVFDQTAACVRHVFLPFNIHVVVDSPGSTPRREIMLTTTGSVLGSAYAGTNVVAPFDGDPHDNVIGFVFATTIGPTLVDALCQDTALTAAFLYGLEYVVSNCADIEDFSTGCGEKSFTNLNSTCDGNIGGNPGHCLSGTTTQNSYAKILGVAMASDFVMVNSFESFELPHAGPSP